MKKYLALILVLLLLLTGCERENHLAQAKPAVSTPEGTELTLKILTEDLQQLYGTRMGTILEIVMKRFRAEYPNVTFEIEYLPNTEKEVEEREMRIDQLRYEILAGEGPDIYLLPDSNYTPYSTGSGWREPLFADMNVAMRNGVFHELSAYYDADESLHKEELKQEIMDAGTFGKARYILPLAYDMQVVHVNEALAAEYGMTVEELTASADSLQAAVLRAMEESGEASLSSCLGYDELMDFYPFGQILDYDEGKVLVSAKELAERLQRALDIDRLWRSSGQSRKFFSDCTMAEAYFECDFTLGSWYVSEIPAYVEGAQHAFEYGIIRQLDGGKYTSYPVRSNDGTVTAKVIAWGAVGSGCDYADVAYDFLREFLTREVQWDLERHESTSNDSLAFCWDGIPVRTKGLVAPMLARFKTYYKELDRLAVRGDKERVLEKLDALLAVEMTDEDFPILDTEINHVLFSSTYEWDYRSQAWEWYDFDTRSFKKIDLDQFAADYIRDLEFFLAES